ncbi:hypothetical protein HGO38_05720 [Rhizobium sp. CG5]|uniref:hypothetical protein n=1 Tax=Rhizobium sp. CG5 TaxID=2726076 RepID=UPI002033905B|nr:hypothetical protein [Rhizobium sp. CG5]MCM2472973.1 hypothetical protein [Rhizobium sp. CG5]
MNSADMFRVGAGAAGILIACLGLSGCVGSPTYGTDKTAAEQLADDVGSIASIGSNPNKGGDIKQNPRPNLVMPPDTAKAELVAPQQSLASKDNPEWLEAPEETRKRLVEEADANADNPRYRSPLLAGYGSNGTMTETQKWEAFREARKVQKGAYLDQRRFLSEPPSEYRQASDPAVLDDLGEPEDAKAKRRKKEAKAASQTSSWWMPFQ